MTEGSAFTPWRPPAEGQHHPRVPGAAPAIHLAVAAQKVLVGLTQLDAAPFVPAESPVDASRGAQRSSSDRRRATGAWIALMAEHVLALSPPLSGSLFFLLGYGGR